jgi:hypothetical protein
MTSPLSRTIAVILLAALAGCGKEEAPAPRGIPGGVDRPAPPRRAPEPEAEAPQPEPSFGRKRPNNFELEPGDLMAQQAKPAEEPAAGEPAKDERNLGQEVAELARRSGCLDLAAAAQQPGGKLKVSVSAYLMPSGRITRATVSASGQPSSALRCAEQRVVQAGLTGPFEKAESVSGETTIEVVAATAAPAQAAAPAPATTAVYPNRPPVDYGPDRAPPPAQADMAQRTSDYSVTGTARPDEQAGAP